MTFANGFNTWTNDKGEKVNKQGVSLNYYKCGGSHISNDPYCPKANKIEPVKSYSPENIKPVPFNNKIPSTNDQLDSEFFMTPLESDDKKVGLNSTLYINVSDKVPSFGELCYSIIPLILKIIRVVG